MSKFKDLTENTPLSSSGENTGDRAQPSLPLASTDNTPPSISTMRTPSKPMLSDEKNGFTTPVTTEKTRQHAMLVKVALMQLEKVGLIKRYKVLSKDGTTVQRIRIEFDMSEWSDDLELKVL